MKPLVEIGGAESSRDIEQARVRFLGKKVYLQQQLKRVGSLPTQERRAFGQAVNDAKQLLTDKIAERVVQLDRWEQDAALTSGRVDVSLTGQAGGDRVPSPRESYYSTNPRYFSPFGLRCCRRAGNRGRLPQLRSPEYSAGPPRPGYA